MKKFFLVLFLGFFLFSCNNEINENINSGSNENQNLENNEEVANLKITAELEPNFEFDDLWLDLKLIFVNQNHILYWKEQINSFKNDKRFELYDDYKDALDEKIPEILKEFPDLEKNLYDSEEKFNGFNFRLGLGIINNDEENYLCYENEPEIGGKINLKIDGNYNPDFKGNLYNFPFYYHYCPGCQEFGYSEVLTAKNTGKNTYSIEKTEDRVYCLYKKEFATVLGTSNHTFEKIPEKISIDLASISEIYKKYPEKGNDIKLTINYEENNNIQIEKIEYNNGKNIDLNDEEFYICSEYNYPNPGKDCRLDLAKILENEDIENITIYTKQI